MSCLQWFPADDTPMDTQEVRVQGVIYTIEPGVPVDIPQEHYAAVTAALQALQGGTMAAPGTPTVTTQGTTGAATWGYKVAAVGQTGDSQLSAQGTTTGANGNATLTGTNLQQIAQPSLPAHATGWRVVRTASGGTPAGVNVDISGVLPLGQATFNDTGIAGVAYTPAGAAPPVDLVVTGPTEL